MEGFDVNGLRQGIRVGVGAGVDAATPCAANAGGALPTVQPEPEGRGASVLLRAW
jgi:hypothetical protein